MKRLLDYIPNNLRARLRRFGGDKSGAAAVEFVFIAPLMITLYLGTMEISQGIEVNKKVGRAASIAGDLVAQNDPVTKAMVEDIMNIGAAVMQPYKRDKPTMTISSVKIDASGVSTIVWSRRGTGTTYSVPFAVGSPVSVPANLKIPDTYLIKVETKLDYLPVTSWSIKRDKTGPNGAYASIPMGETYYLRPRRSPEVKCADC